MGTNYTAQNSTTVSALNEQLEQVQEALGDTLSRSGATPNELNATLDMNSNPIINLPFPTDPTSPVRLQDIQSQRPDLLVSDVFVFDSVALMRATETLTEGQVAICKRYYTGGELVDGLVYEIQASQAVDGFVDHALANGNVAKLIYTEVVQKEQAGGINDATDAVAIDAINSLPALCEAKFQRVKDDGVVSGAHNLSWIGDYTSVAEDVRMSAILFGGHLGFPNVIGSFSGSGASYSTIVGGYDNIIDSIAGTIGGGAHHRIFGDEPNSSHNTIAGGSFNEILRGEYSTISGGTLNLILKNRIDGTPVNSTHSFIAGGNSNKIRGGNSSIGGGLNNSTDGDSVVIAGGQNNTATGNFNIISGGGNNQCLYGDLKLGQKNTIGGGRFNIIDGATNPIGNTISGGENNETSGVYNTISGGFNNQNGTKTVQASYSVMGGGLDNTITGVLNASTISGGRSNSITAEYATVVGGRENSAQAQYSTASGYKSVATRAGEHVNCSGAIATNGDVSASNQHVYGQSLAASSVDLKTGLATKPTARLGYTTLLSINLVGRDSAGASQAWKVEALFDGFTVVGVPTVTSLFGAITGATVSIAGTGSSSIDLNCGATNQTNWSAKIEYVEVSV